MTAYRIAGYGRLDSGRRLRFNFDGKIYQGLQGDTLASALLANGVHLVGRSFKYHRPRGILTAGPEEPNALVQIDRGPGRAEPNTRATTQELFDGLTAVSQNRWPSLHHDIGAVVDVAHDLVPAGFYYKTFMWPQTFWNRVYEPFIRRAAGLGTAPKLPDPDQYSARYAHCDVLVVGAGPAGLAAVLVAARAGARVILVDEQAEIGGSLLFDPQAIIDGLTAWVWLERSRRDLEEHDNVVVLPRTTAIGYYHQNFVGLAQRLTDHLPVAPDDTPRERLWRVRAKQVVLAQGAIERPLLFDGNDRPGVMLASAARQYLNRYAVLVGRRLVVATIHDSAYQVAFDLAEAGADVVAIIDARSSVPQALEQRTGELGIALHKGTTVYQTAGRHRIKSVRIGRIANRDQPSITEKISCDALLMCGGWTPSVHLFSHTKGSLDWRPDLASFVPDHSLEAVRCAGAGNGTFVLSQILAEGTAAGAAAAKDAGFDVSASLHSVEDEHNTEHEMQASDQPTYDAASRSRAFVDFQNDVTVGDILLAVREGFHSVEHVKRYTTTGMATDQGKTSNLNSLSIIADALGKTSPQVGLTTFRPPYTPTTFGTLAGNKRGRYFEATRQTPVDRWAEEHGAVFEPVGPWRRARYFPDSGEDMEQAVNRECRSTRQSLGIFDASTLGKIEIIGPDAAEFLDRMYTISVSDLTPGRCRYALTLGDDGYIRDDGIIARLAPDLFHVTTGTGTASRTLALMEDYLQTEWPDLKVWLTSITEQWAVIALNGPNARQLLGRLVEDIDLSPSAFPHMSVRQGAIGDVPIRLFRVGFTGELGFEINIPARYGHSLWTAFLDAGRELGITPYGTETMHVLRAEMGYIIVGQDTDGTVTPDDAGLAWMIGKKKPDFVGKRSLSRPNMSDPSRRQLVGLLTDDPKIILEEGAQIVADPTQPIPMTMIGHITSSYWSVALGRSIALALVEGGRGRVGDRVFVPMPEQTHAVEVTTTVFFDPEKGRTVSEPTPHDINIDLAPMDFSVEIDLGPRLRIETILHCARFCLRIDLVHLADAEAALGASLPRSIGEATQEGAMTALRLGPDELVLWAPDAKLEPIKEQFGALYEKTPCSLVDISHRQIGLEISGDDAAQVLNTGCPLDLRQWPVGRGTRTVFEQVEIVVLKTAEARYRIDVSRSFAPFISGLLAAAAREIEADQ